MFMQLKNKVKKMPKHLQFYTVKMQRSYKAYGSLYRHVVCNVPVSPKANRGRIQLGAWRYSDPKAD